MKKWRVEVEVLGFDEEDALDHLNLHPGDAVVTELSSKLEAGWYNYNGGHYIRYWSKLELNDIVDDDDFLETHTRFHEPKRYTESLFEGRVGTFLTEDEFDALPDGSAIVDKDGDKWIRVGGRWTHPEYDWLPYYGDYQPYTVSSVG